MYTDDTPAKKTAAWIGDALAVLTPPERAQALRTLRAADDEVVQLGLVPKLFELGDAASIEAALEIVTSTLDAVPSDLTAKIARVPELLDWIEPMPSLANDLTQHQLTTLLSGSCDAAHRRRAVALATKLHANVDAVGKSIDACISRRAKLEPIFRAWLAPAH